MVATAERTDEDLALHVRADGQTYELTLAQLGLTPLTPDTEVKDSVARFLDKAEGTLSRHQVVRSREAVIVRPEAIYG